MTDKQITAQEAKEIANKAISRNRNNDISKTQTIMRDIKARAEKGHTSYEYRAYINYAIAKTLYGNGFKLLEKDRELFLEDFQNNTTFYSVIISWEQNNDR